MNITEILEKKDCCGCSSCIQKCPKNAIEMQANEEGFLYPKIDKKKCINCEICIKACPQLKKMKLTNTVYPKSYAMYNKNYNEQLKSSSGGIFSAISNYVLENNGVVFGAAFDSSLQVKHIKVDNKENLDLLRTSKYVQSNINGTYKDAENELKNNRFVFFTGTPCQIAGLNTYLAKKYENLITADFVCHGVPSQKLFDKYIEYLSNKYHSKVTKYNFRNKEKKGWALVSKIETESGKIKYIEPGLDPYYSNFLRGTTYRESCYSCRYTNCNRISDITLADYFAITKIHADFYNENGVSLILINNEKGMKIINKISKNIEFIETDLEFAANNNENLLRPSKRLKERDNIYDEINILDGREYTKQKLKVNYTAKKIIQALIPIKIKKYIKKIRIKKTDYRLENKK